MTKRANGDSITLDNDAPQSLEFAQQLETGPFLIRIDRSIHDSYVRDSLLDDPLIDSDNESVVNNAIRGSRKPCSSDCFTHAMIRRCSRIVLEADTIIASCGLEKF